MGRQEEIGFASGAECLTRTVFGTDRFTMTLASTTSIAPIAQFPDDVHAVRLFDVLWRHRSSPLELGDALFRRHSRLRRSRQKDASRPRTSGH
jgi:hypothetical protein